MNFVITYTAGSGNPYCSAMCSKVGDVVRGLGFGEHLREVITEGDAPPVVSISYKGLEGDSIGADLLAGDFKKEFMDSTGLYMYKQLEEGR